ncbi:hypothetical protein VTL71DRAFT_1629 [Oculimacula yallundae]|uniref:Xylanolytic transcriptional activator regulatory domain-containing protein n=1 Tax=Oculimacula yallundae TaxID=86028 RepID=A0ABR4CB99_9HELO
MAAMMAHMKASGISVPGIGLENAPPSPNIHYDDDLQEDQAEDEDIGLATPESAESARCPTPPVSTATTFNERLQMYGNSPIHNSFNQAPSTARTNPSVQPDAFPSSQTDSWQQRDEGVLPTFRASSSGQSQHRSQERAQEQGPAPVSMENDGTGLSPCEARVAGVFHEHGCVASVHGLAGIMNPTRRALHKENISKVSRKGGAAVESSQARLISNAILQRQRENRLFRQPQQIINLDGCEPDLAKHLITLHFNRHHCSYLITYRPAILDSIANRGPWVNELLLNAIYYSSSLHSDRLGLRASVNDPESAGSRFYDRFCQLLVDAMGRPSVPSAVALLLTSATLVARGKVSAGWALSGAAYRMIIDLGCHLMLGPDYQENSAQTTTQMLQKDIEHEMRKRLYWGAYMTDVTQSLYLGRQCSFATTEARVPLQLLDTFEELDEWEPYQDPCDPAGLQPAYAPQPTYAISSFNAWVSLMRIGARISELYGICTVGYKTEVVLEKKAIIESQLEIWTNMLPDHLVFDPQGSNIPPPHQITPHTTFHTLRILLHRAFMEEGHLRRHSDDETKSLSEQECITSALIIEKYIRAYRKTFTLRRAPFLLSYAIYSAVAIILPQERHDRGHFTELISFFWTCLGELQHGCHSGLKKPLSVLWDMAREFEISTKERGMMATQQLQFGTLDETLFPQLPQDRPSLDNEVYSSTQYLYDMNPQHDVMDSLQSSQNFVPPDLMNFINDQERDISQNTLYGLFAPTQFF